jgi:sodium pump decarboxylase gamma subunit
MMILAEQGFTTAPWFEEHGIPLAVMGIVVVFMALAILVVFVNLLPRMLELGSGRKLKESPIEESPVPELDVEGELSEETLVVIAAAVAETIRQPHRIIQIRGLTPSDLGWSLEGRIQHHQSHRVHHRGNR